MDQADTQPRVFSLPERIQIARTLHRFGLGLVRLPGITHDAPVCHGKAHACQCPDCKAKPPELAPEQPAQPWEPRPARRAA